MGKKGLNGGKGKHGKGSEEEGRRPNSSFSMYHLPG